MKPHIFTHQYHPYHYLQSHRRMYLFPLFSGKHLKTSDAKAFKCRLKFSFKISIFITLIQGSLSRELRPLGVAMGNAVSVTRV